MNGLNPTPRSGAEETCPNVLTMAPMPTSSMKVPIASVMKLAPVLRRAGAVENTASFRFGSSVAPQWL